MNSKEQLVAVWTSVQESFRIADRDEASLTTRAYALMEFAHVARSVGKDELSRGTAQLAKLIDVSVTWIKRYPDDKDVVNEIVDFADSNLCELEAGIESGDSNPKIDAMIELSNETWSDYFSTTTGSLGAGLPLTDIFDAPCESAKDDSVSGVESSLESSPESETDAVLDVFSGVTDAATNAEPLSVAQRFERAIRKAGEASKIDGAENAREELRADREMLDAYLDDSFRCVAAMESAALALDEQPDCKESIRAFCRELHTLKGASATVGLNGLAKRMHDLETSLEEVFSENGNADLESLFEAIDFVRSEMELLNPQRITESPKSQTTTDATSVSPIASISQAEPATSFATNENSSIRVRAAQLDRLMDMLAELVVLRNRRESNASEFDLLYGELSRCSTRLSIVEEQSGQVANTSVVGEVSKDIEAVARGFRSLQKPVANDNAAITRFIRDFRQELMRLRRIPVSGLFGRLQRAARDSAKKEKKQVRVEVKGENTGLEQEIQERLYESLLHVVRNCVSHGIQAPEIRAAAGKDEAGTITLEAISSAQLLVIEVRDDGNGVNHEAIRNRGLEKGLLAANQEVSNDELANLIFHPGFSTKETASEVSGRGVGMDVVATTMEQLRGRIEVESVTGKGTTIRLLIPRRTGIEHVMVFRSQDQLYALPMQSIVAAKKSREGFDSLSRLAFSGNHNQRSNNVLVIKRSGLADDGQDSHIAITVDELVGPEEVVVRGLPPMLRNHPLFCGITLSGSGEKMLLLETESVANYCKPESELEYAANAGFASHSGFKALVVDDSITARKYISKLLKANGYGVVEAGDGLEAIEKLHRSSFDLVVTDLDMPRLGGLELLSDIRNGKYCDAPVIVITSRGEASFRDHAMEYGASCFINKPVSKQQFQQQLEKLGLTLTTCQER